MLRHPGLVTDRVLERLHHRWLDDPLPPVRWGQPLPVFSQAEVAEALTTGMRSAEVRA